MGKREADCRTSILLEHKLPVTCYIPENISYRCYLWELHALTQPCVYIEF